MRQGSVLLAAGIFLVDLVWSTVTDTRACTGLFKIGKVPFLDMIKPVYVKCLSVRFLLWPATHSTQKCGLHGSHICTSNGNPLCLQLACPRTSACTQPALTKAADLYSKSAHTALHLE